MAKLDRGEFLAYGSGCKADSFNRTTHYLGVVGYPLLSIFLAGLGLFMCLKGELLIGLALLIPFSILVPLILFKLDGFAYNGVFENGLTVRTGMKLKDVIDGNHWVPWHKITKIEYGATKGFDPFEVVDTEYVKIYVHEWSSRVFTKLSYKDNDFYTTLVRKLQENCPASYWVRKNILHGQWDEISEKWGGTKKTEG